RLLERAALRHTTPFRLGRSVEPDPSNHKAKNHRAPTRALPSGMQTEHGHLLAVAVGNTRTRFGVFHGNELDEPVSLPNSDMAALTGAVLKAAQEEHGISIVISSVNPPVSDALIRALEDAGEENVYRIGRDLPIPMQHTLDDASTVGQDRLLCAFGAYARAKQACVVVDAGTAGTVDFVDGEGRFRGGVIAPGAQMMLDALHAKTAQLPQLSFMVGHAQDTGSTTQESPAAPFGRNTREAMLLGVTHSIRGLVQHAVERYAEFFGGYPQV